MDKVDAYMKRWHEHQRELKEGGATWCLACLEYGHLPDVCPYEDPLFVQAFDRGEVETAEEWIHLKAVPSPQGDQETCLTCLKGEEWCFAVGKVGHKAPDQPPPWQEVELLVLKKGRSGGAKKAKKQASAPEWESVRPQPRRGRCKLQQQQQLQQQQEEVGDDGWEVCVINLVAELCPGCGAYGHTSRAAGAASASTTARGRAAGAASASATSTTSSRAAGVLLVPPQLPWEDCLPLPPPPAEGECLLVPPQPPWEDCLPLPAPPAEGECLLVPPQPPWEDCLPLPPPPAEGEHLLVPTPPLWEGLLLPCLAPPKDACLTSPKDACLFALPKDACLASPKDACLASPGAACCSASPGEPPVTGNEEEVKLPLPPPWPGAPLPSSPPEGPLLLLLPSPPEGLLLLPLPLEGPVLPGVATGPAMRQEILCLEPHEGQLPATKQGGEVRRPASPAALSRQEILWLEPHEGQLPAPEKGGEIRGPAPPAALSRQEILWLQRHEGQLPAMKKGGQVWRTTRKYFWPEEPACERAIGTLQLFGWEEDIPPWPQPLARCCPCSCAGTGSRDFRE
ncbi:UNVERIFIED_CONTAM: hypothetical protein FKN15_021764 [Acipenser sinensis]